MYFYNVFLPDLFFKCLVGIIFGIIFGAILVRIVEKWRTLCSVRKARKNFENFKKTKPWIDYESMVKELDYWVNERERMREHFFSMDRLSVDDKIYSRARKNYEEAKYLAEQKDKELMEFCLEYRNNIHHYKIE